MDTQRLQNIGLYVLIAVFGFIAALMLLPFFQIIALGGILAVLFSPIKRRISGRVKSEMWVCIITFIIALVIILLPVYGLGQLVFNEVNDLYSRRTEQASFSFNQDALINYLPEVARGAAENLLNNAGQKISDFAGNIFQSITSVATNVAGFMVDFVLAGFTFYYLLRDGGKFRNFVEHIFPLSRKHELMLAEKLETAVKGVVQGSFLTALIQGTVATIGFLIFGVPAAFLWGAVTVLAALVPTFGTALSLVPAVLYLFITGHTGAGIGLAIWGVIAVGTIDNVLGPQLVGSRAKLHPLLALFSVLGGVGLFGVLGFLIGPILMSIFVALLDIYRAGIEAE